MALQTVAVRQGTKYGPEYTAALKVQMPGIVVLGDDRPLQTDFTGWYAKIELFAPWNADLRPCLYFDLDTFVMADLLLFGYLDTDELWLIDDFNSPKRGETGIMVIPKNVDEIWENRAKMLDLHADGPYLREFPHKRLNRMIDGIYSYKNHCRDACPDDARIICFHGFPKQHELKKGWACNHWNTIISQTTKSSVS